MRGYAPIATNLHYKENTLSELPEKYQDSQVKKKGSVYTKYRFQMVHHLFRSKDAGTSSQSSLVQKWYTVQS